MESGDSPGMTSLVSKEVRGEIFQRVSPRRGVRKRENLENVPVNLTMTLFLPANMKRMG